MTLELIGDIPEPPAAEFPIVDVVDDGKAASFEAGTVDTALPSSLDDEDGFVLLSSTSLLSSLSSSLDEATSDMYYEVDIPVTEHGLLLKLKGSNLAAATATATATAAANDGDDDLKQVAVFDGYVRHSGGIMGPAEVQQLVQNLGDVLVSADGVDLSNDQNSFKQDIMPQLRDLVKEKDSIRFQFADGTAYWRRRQHEAQQATTRATALNDAYKAMEEMRKLKLEEEFAETIASGEVINLNRCTLCLRAELQDRQQQQQQKQQQRPAVEENSEKNERPMLKAARSFRLDGSRIKKAKNRMAKTNPCLICGMTTCAKHSCETFRSEGSTVCIDCARLFSLEFMMDCVHHDDNIRTVDHDGTTGQTNNSHLDFIVDMYDRVLLVLKFSAQYTNDIAEALEHQVKRNNGIGVGSNVTGLVSGITGIVAAATLFTPAGPPLLIASLIFGGTATAVSSGSEAVNYLSEPRKVADKIIAMHGVAKSLLRITGILRDALLRDHIHVDHYLEQEESTASPSNQQEKLEKVKETLEKDSVKIGQGAGTATAAYVAAATEIGSISASAASAELRVMTTARSTRFFSRSASAAMKTARVARFAGGFLCAATIVFEVKDMHSTVKRIQAGNPCEKADMIRAIMKEVETFPDTETLYKECENYFAVMAKRRETERMEEVQSVVPVAQNEEQNTFKEDEQVETVAQTEEANSSRCETERMDEVQSVVSTSSPT